MTNWSTPTLKMWEIALPTPLRIDAPDGFCFQFVFAIFSLLLLGCNGTRSVTRCSHLPHIYTCVVCVCVQHMVCKNGQTN